MQFHAHNVVSFCADGATTKACPFSSSALWFLTLDQGFLHQVCACFQCGFPNLVKMPPLDSSSFVRICVQMHVCCFQRGFPNLLKCLLILILQPLRENVLVLPDRINCQHAFPLNCC